MKAQFFILGAIMLCILFFIGLPLYGPQVQSSRNDISFISGNLESEFPKALNLGLKSGFGTQTLADFSGFAGSTLSGQNIKFRSLWVVAEIQDSDLRIIVGNFMGEVQGINVTIEGDSQDFSVPDSSTQSRVFSGVPDRFQIKIDFPGHSWTGEWLKSKVSLYAFIETGRGTDLVVKEAEA